MGERDGDGDCASSIVSIRSSLGSCTGRVYCLARKQPGGAHACFGLARDTFCRVITIYTRGLSYHVTAATAAASKTNQYGRPFFVSHGKARTLGGVSHMHVHGQTFPHLAALYVK